MSGTRTVFVTGASRGIGLGFVEQYADAGWRVLASCRDLSTATDLTGLAASHGGIELFELDVTQPDATEALSTELGEMAIDVLVNNAGIYGRKRLPLAQVDRAEWLSVLEVNALAPFFVTRALLPQLDLGESKVVAMLGSKVGSMADNAAGGNFAYRTSKAALNQVVKTLSIDLADRGLLTVALHPGWVQTDMGGPNALIDIEESVRGLRKVIDELRPDQSGSFLSFDGRTIPW